MARKEFNCAKCGIPYNKDSSSYYKQLKKFGANYCKSCGYDIGVINSVNTKYGDAPRSDDTVVVPCSKCGRPRTIKKNSSKYANICVNCAQSDRSKKMWKKDGFRIKAVAAAKRNWERNRPKLIAILNTKEYKDKQSKRMLAKWQNQEFRNKILKSLNTEECRDKLSKSSIKLWQSDKFRKAILIAANTPESKLQKSIAAKNNWNKNRQQILANLRSEKTINRLREVCGSEEHRKRCSVNSIKLWQREDYRKKIELLWQNDEYQKRMAILRANTQSNSKIQNILYSILDDLKIIYIKEYAIGFYNFDCFIPDKSLLIEVQGDYWHNLPNNIRRDKSKSTYLMTYFPKYNLKYLWEHEFNNKNRIIELVKYWCGLKQELISFSFSEITEKLISYKEAELFISKYHYAGRVGRSGLNIGYFIGDTLIATTIYVSPTRKETASKQGLSCKKVLELSRVAINPQYQIKNLASNIIAKSISYIKINRPEIELLVSFADTTHNHLGTIYKASNWKLDGEVKPDYWYADNNGYICHKKTLWNHATSLRMTESEYCNKYNYAKIIGKKKYRYIYDLRPPVKS